MINFFQTLLVWGLHIGPILALGLFIWEAWHVRKAAHPVSSFILMAICAAVVASLSLEAGLMLVVASVLMVALRHFYFAGIDQTIHG